VRICGIGAIHYVPLRRAERAGGRDGRSSTAPRSRGFGAIFRQRRRRWAASCRGSYGNPTRPHRRRRQVRSPPAEERGRGGEGEQERQAGRQAGIFRCRCRETGTERAAEGGGGGAPPRLTRRRALPPPPLCAELDAPELFVDLHEQLQHARAPRGPASESDGGVYPRASQQTPRPAPQRPLSTRVSERAPPRARAQHARRRPPGAGASPLASPTGRRAR
jgi:hypothetical protein